MTRSGPILAAAILMGMPAACATQPEVTTAVVGDPGRLLAAGGYRLSEAPDAPAGRAVEAAMARRGWTARPDAPDVTVEVAYAARPAPLGAFSGEGRPEGDDGWLEAPRPRRWWRRAEEARTLTLRLLDPGSGRAVVEARAVGRTAPGRDEHTLDALAEALFQPAGSSTTKAPSSSS